MATLKECPKCGKMVDPRGLDVHMRYCKGEGNVSRETKEVDKQESTKKCHVCNGTEIKRIDTYCNESGKKYDKAKLYGMGYTHVCTSCGELLK